MDGDGPLTSSLSDEILLLIIGHLDLENVINLSQTCTKFDNLIKDKSICRHLSYRWDFKLTRLTFVKFLRNGDRAAVITKLNLNDVYWVPSGVIRDVTKQLINLKELHVAGTQLNWKHLVEILSPSQNLIGLSWSWDNRAEMTRRIGLAKLVPDVPNPSDVAIIKPHLERLKFLLIHVPMVQNCHSPSYSFHPGLSYFVSMCTNLKELWLLSWSKTEAERKLIEIFGEENLVENINFPHLTTFTIRVMRHQRLYTPKLTNAMLKNIGENENGGKFLHQLWLDHPLLSGSWISSVDRISGYTALASHSWPKLNLNSVERLSLPLIEKSVEWLYNGNNFEKVKYLQITDGLPRIVNLNGLFDMAHDLESFTINAINTKLDWNRFVHSHSKLCEVNVCKDDHFPYPEICVALSKLKKNLRKLALPIFALMEIKNSSIINDYRAASSSYVDKGVNLFSDIMTKSEEYGIKKKRISRHQGSTITSQSISGVDLLTQSCSTVEEFELGFSTVTRPGTIITSSLMTISNWKNLTKLTIENVPIHDGQFLINIAKSCKKLHSLRLKTLGNRAKCSYIQDLCSAVTFMGELRDFRFEQNYIGSSSKLFCSLQCCPKLQRFLLWSHMNELPLDPGACLSLMAACQDLTMLYLTCGATTKHVCDSIRKAIELNYKKLRPALSVIIRRGSDIIEDALPIIYPSVHYRQMVDFSSQIGQQMDFNVH